MEKIKVEASAIEAKYGVQVELIIDDSTESPATPVDAEVVTMLSKAIEKVHGKKTQTIGIGGGTVAAPLRQAGFNALVWSTLDDMAHQPNEYCIMKNLIDDTQVLAALMYGVDAL